MDCIYFPMYCFISLIFLDYRHTAKSHDNLSGKLSEYGLIVPFSTDSRGRYISHVVSAAAAAAGGSPPGRKRVSRSAPGTPSFSSPGRRLFFNVTVFGKELHIRLKANRRLVAPGAFVEWHEDFEEISKERLHGDCVFTGDVTDMPEASAAISNCDGLFLLRLRFCMQLSVIHEGVNHVCHRGSGTESLTLDAFVFSPSTATCSDSAVVPKHACMELQLRCL